MPSPVGIEEGSLSRGAQNRYHATAHAVAGDVAAIAYSVERSNRGPNGESHQAFVVCSHDAGATWAPVPLVRTIGSSIRFWGFPVWPPEYIDTMGVERGLLRIGFRDDWVPFEPGGESLWTATHSSRRLWTVARIRLMDYDGRDVPGAPPPIDVELPPGFGLPSLRMLEVIASRVAADGPSRFADRYY